MLGPLPLGRGVPRRRVRRPRAHPEAGHGHGADLQQRLRQALAGCLQRASGADPAPYHTHLSCTSSTGPTRNLILILTPNSRFHGSACDMQLAGQDDSIKSLTVAETCTNEGAGHGRALGAPTSFRGPAVRPRSGSPCCRPLYAPHHDTNEPVSHSRRTRAASIWSTAWAPPCPSSPPPTRSCSRWALRSPKPAQKTYVLCGIYLM